MCPLLDAIDRDTVKRAFGPGWQAQGVDVAEATDDMVAMQNAASQMEALFRGVLRRVPSEKGQR